MTRVKKAELRRLAEAAAHKDWYAGNAYDKPFILNSQIITDTPDGKYVLLDGNHHFRADCVANVAFVGAASPAVVLSLLDSEAQAKCEARHAIYQKDAAYAECKALRAERDAALAELEACKSQIRALIHISDATGWERHTCGEIAKARSLVGGVRG